MAAKLAAQGGMEVDNEPKKKEEEEWKVNNT